MKEITSDGVKDWGAALHRTRKTRTSIGETTHNSRLVTSAGAKRVLETIDGWSKKRQLAYLKAIKDRQKQ